MITAPRPWTRAELARLPDDTNRYEVLDGELLVTPLYSPRHQFIARDLAVALQRYCDQHGIGTLVAPGTVVFGANELQPDVLLTPGPEPALESRWEDLPLPLLVAEVESDVTVRRDRGIKADAYRRIGIPTYWAVDAVHRSVLVFTPESEEPATVTGVLSWRPRGDIPALEIPIATLLGP